MTRSQMSTELKDWLNHTAYPKLTHDQVFSTLAGYTKAEFSETRYANCPRCHRPGAFYMLENRHVGQCSSCGVVIAWFGFLRFGHTDQEAIASIAALAEIEPLPPTSPDSTPIFRL